MTTRQKPWLVVLACALLSMLQPLGLAGLRWRQARTRFDVTPSDWRVVWAYSSYLGFGDFDGKLAALETVRAIAPGRAIAFQAADDERLILDLAGRDDLADRVVAHELARSPWPKARGGAWLPIGALLRLMRPGRTDDARRLALRAAAEFTPSEGLFFHELSIVLLARNGEYDEALRHFDRVRREVPATSVHRETLLAAGASRRALGDPGAATQLEAGALHAASAPMLTAQPEPSGSPIRAYPTLRTAAAIVNPEVPTAHWGSVLRAGALVALSWLGLPAVLALLAWKQPNANGPTRCREIVGALALAGGTLAAVNAYVICTSSGFEPYVVAPFAYTGSTWFWLSELAALCVVLLAISLVESQSLRDLGWKVSPSATRYSVLAVGFALLLASFRVLRGIEWALHARAWFPALLVGSALISLYWGVLEETLYRGYLMRALARLTSRFWLVNLGQSACFAASHVAVHHVENGLWTIGIWVLMALICGWLASRSQSLWPPFIFHSVYDVLVIYAAVMPQYDDFRAMGVLLE